MNKRKIFFSGVIVSLIGAALGLVLATMFDPPFTSKYYRHIRRVYVIVGGAGGFLYGASISAVKQLKELQEARDEQILAARQNQQVDAQSDHHPSPEG